MLIVAARMNHETATFSPVPTPLSSFGPNGPTFGSAALEARAVHGRGYCTSTAWSSTALYVRLRANWTATRYGGLWPVTATDPRPSNGCSPSEAVGQLAWANDD